MSERKNPFEYGAEMGKDILEEFNRSNSTKKSSKEETSPEDVIKAGDEKKFDNEERRKANNETVRNRKLSPEEVEARGHFDELIREALVGGKHDETEILEVTRNIRTAVFKRLKGKEVKKEDIFEELYKFANEKLKTKKSPDDSGKTEIKGRAQKIAIILEMLEKEKAAKEAAARKKGENEASGKSGAKTNKKTSASKDSQEPKVRLTAEEKKLNKKLEEIKNKIFILKNEIIASKESLERINEDKKNLIKTIKERISVQEEQLEKLEFSRDMLEAEEVESVDGAKGKKAIAKKLEKKPQKATSVDSGKKFEGMIIDEVVKGGVVDFGARIGHTSNINSIKKCSDGSYIIETSTSYYRLTIEEDGTSKTEEAENADTKKQEEVKAQMEKEEKEAAEEAIKNSTSEKKEWTLDEVYAKLTAAGAQDKDVDYFFSLHKKDRLDFLNSNDEELAIRIEKLREKREANEARDLEFEGLEKDQYDKAREQKLILLGEKVRNSRLLYLKKEYDVNKISAKMKRFFSGIKKLNLGNAEEEVQELRNEYRLSLTAFSDAIVDIEGITDKEEQEIMLNYLGVSEALNLQGDKLVIKKGNDPKSLQLVEDVLGSTLKGYLKGYKSIASYLSKKGAELVGQKTDSKILKFAGGLSGGMAFSVGLSNIFKTTGAPYWVTKSILLATSTAAMTMENKENMDKELGEQEVKDIEARKIKALEEMETKIQDELAQAMKNIFASEANTSLDYQENKEAINKKMWAKAFAKAAGKNLFFYSAGLGASELVKDFSGFLVELKNDMFGEEKSTTNISPEIPNNVQDKPKVIESIIYSKEELEKVAGSGVTSTHGGDLHLKSNPLGSSQKVENIYETFKRLGIEVEGSGQTADSAAAVSPEEKEAFIAEAQPESEKFEGMELDKYGRGSVKVIENLGIKDSVAKFLVDNSEKLTEGNMGWDPNSNAYTSVEEWADKRAIGIVGELKSQFPNYDFDKVSTETIITLDMSDKADIKIAAIEDPYRLGGSDGNVENPVTEKEQVELKESVSMEAKRMTTNEMSIAYSAGISAPEYARINDLTVEEFLRDTNEANANLKEIVQTLNDRHTIEGPWVSVAGALRNINEDEFAAIFGDKKLEGFKYEDYLVDILKSEVTEMMQLNSEQRVVFEELLKIKKESISNLDSKVFQSFMEVTREKLGVVEVENNATVGSYVIKTIRKAYEMGEMDNLRLALSRIKL
ncbi:MAG: hypothetical protein ACWGHO_00600 [Candidatus Moraniibacteriota bacterium]